MALTLNNFWGAETGGLEEVYSSAGTPIVGSSNARSGSYAYGVKGTGETLTFDPFESVADAGAGYVCGFSVEVTNGFLATPFIKFVDKASTDLDNDFHAALAVISGARLAIWDSGGIPRASGTTTLVAGNVYYIEIYLSDIANSADMSVYLDGVLEVSTTSQDFLNANTSVFDAIAFDTGIDNITETWYDDIYFLSGATAASDRFGDCEIFSYRSSKNSTTPDDGGDLLDVGTWLGVQTLPFDATIGAEYTASGASGSVDTDDVGGSAGTGGPNTDANIDGDSNIKAIKGVWRMKRSGGGGSAHYGLLGNNTDGTTRTADFNPPTSAANYFMVSESASIVPTSGQYCRIGFETTGGQDFECYEMLAQILHVPGAWVQRPRRVSVIT